MTAIEKLISVAMAEIGYLEKKSNAQLDSKTANAGSGNFTKYARDLDAVPGFYNGVKNGYAWCDVFHDWCMVQAFGVELAKKMMYHNQYGAGCAASAAAYEAAGALFGKPQIGDQAFFGVGGEFGHTGIVVAIGNGIAYTIEGNTSGASGVVPNGGGVCKKHYSYYDTTIKYGRPNYSLYKEMEEDEDMERYAYLKDIPNEWGAHDMVDKLMSAEVIAGDGSDKNGNGDKIDLSKDMVRLLAFNYAAGIYDARLQAKGLSR